MNLVKIVLERENFGSRESGRPQRERGGRRVPKAIDFASVIRSDVAIVVQHTRLDSWQPENALMTTIACAS